MLKDKICLGEEATIIKQGPSPYSLTAETLVLGLDNVCSGVHNGLGHSIACVLIDSFVGPLSWSFLGYVGLLLL